jgi:hypothetical protein
MYKNGTELMSNKAILTDVLMDIEAWGFKIIED